MGTMQTAVEWFEGELAIFLKDIIENKNYVLMEHLFEEAKRKEEINIKSKKQNKMKKNEHKNSNQKLHVPK